jgi:hypothetical protein
LTNLKIDIVDFMDPHNIVVRRSAFLTFSNIRNKDEIARWAKSKRLNSQFSQMEGNFNLQKMSKLVPIPNKSTNKKINKIKL